MAGIGDYTKGKKFELKSGNKPSGFKMMGSSSPVEYNKPAPTKWINLVISGISAIAGAAKKNKAKTEALRNKAKESMKSGVDAATGGSETEGVKKPSEGFKADLKGVRAPK